MAGADYSGQLQGNATIRITDHYNGPVPAGDGPATVHDIPFPINVPCSEHGRRGDRRSMQRPTGELPGASRAWKDIASLVELTQPAFSTAAPTASPQPRPNTLFAVQGLFIP